MTEKLRINRSPFPIFNMGKADLVQTILLFMLFAFTVLIVRSSQSNPPEGRTVWKGVVVIFGVMLSMILFVLAIVKMCFGYSPDDLSYEELIDERRVPREAQTGVITSAEAAKNPHSGKDQGVSYQDDVEQQQSTAALHHSSGYRPRSGISPRRDDDEVACGIELEQCPVEFEHHGVPHEKGTFRVRKVMKDGVCDRQGTCHEGDILVTINGVRIAGMPVSKVHAELRGKAGSSIILGLCMERARTVTERTVVLAPYPQLSTSPRYSGAYTNSGGAARN